MKYRKNLWYHILLSILGGVLFLLLVFTIANGKNSIDTIDRLFMGAAFISSCLFGISLALQPNWIKRYKKQGIHGTNPKSSIGNYRKRQGHHPDCDPFQGHTYKIKNNILCAGCTGLALGSFISIFLMIIFLIFFNDLPRLALLIFIIVGMGFVTLNYIEIVLLKRRALSHVLGNGFLVIGFFFIIIGVFQLTGNVIYGILALIMTFLWLDTRIQLSNWSHAVTCGNCNETCKAY